MKINGMVNLLLMKWSWKKYWNCWFNRTKMIYFSLSFKSNYNSMASPSISRTTYGKMASKYVNIKLLFPSFVIFSSAQKPAKVIQCLKLKLIFYFFKTKYFFLWKNKKMTFVATNYPFYKMNLQDNNTQHSCSFREL